MPGMQPRPDTESRTAGPESSAGLTACVSWRAEGTAHPCPPHPHNHGRALELWDVGAAGQRSGGLPSCWQNGTGVGKQNSRKQACCPVLTTELTAERLKWEMRFPRSPCRMQMRTLCSPRLIALNRRNDFIFPCLPSPSPDIIK